MNSNGQAPRVRRIQSLADYWRQKFEKIIRPGNTASNEAGFPATDVELLRLVDEIIAAFRNTDQIVETRANTKHIRFAENLSDEQAEEMAWDTILETQVAQVGSRNTEVVRSEFPDFMTRWQFVVAGFKISKAAVYNIAQPSYLERFVNNPATELDTKLSNFASNASKAHRQKIADAVKKHGSASFDETTGELRDAAGNVIEVFVKPVKRQLVDVVGPELAQHATIKRARRPRQAGTQASNANASNSNASNATASNADNDSNANYPNSIYENYGEDDNDDTDVDVDNNDHGDDDNHYGNQVRGSAGVDSFNESQNHDERVHRGSDEFPASYHVSSEGVRGTSSHQQTNNALASGIDRQGHIPNSLPFNIAQPNALYPSLPRQSSHLSNLNNPHPNTIQTNALYSDLPHYNSPLPNSQHYAQQSAPAAGSQNGQHLDYVYLSNGHFVIDEDEYEV